MSKYAKPKGKLSFKPSGGYLDSLQYDYDALYTGEGGQDSLNYLDVVDIPRGPMRQLKPAEKFTFKNFTSSRLEASN